MPDTPWNYECTQCGHKGQAALANGVGWRCAECSTVHYNKGYVAPGDREPYHELLSGVKVPPVPRVLYQSTVEGVGPVRLVLTRTEPTRTVMVERESRDAMGTASWREVPESIRGEVLAQALLTTWLHRTTRDWWTGTPLKK